MKKIIALLKNTKAFAHLSDAFVTLAASNAVVANVGAGALIMKVLPLLCFWSCRAASATVVVAAAVVSAATGGGSVTALYIACF
jgi:hypothetical protein